MLNDLKITLITQNDKDRLKKIFTNVLILVGENSVEAKYHISFKEIENFETGRNEFNLILYFLSEYPQLFQGIDN